MRVKSGLAHIAARPDKTTLIFIVAVSVRRRFSLRRYYFIAQPLILAPSRLYASVHARERPSPAPYSVFTKAKRGSSGWDLECAATTDWDFINNKRWRVLSVRYSFMRHLERGSKISRRMRLRRVRSLLLLLRISGMAGGVPFYCPRVDREARIFLCERVSSLIFFYWLGVSFYLLVELLKILLFMTHTRIYEMCNCNYFFNSVKYVGTYSYIMIWWNLKWRKL